MVGVSMVDFGQTVNSMLSKQESESPITRARRENVLLQIEYYFSVTLYAHCLPDSTCRSMTRVFYYST